MIRSSFCFIVMLFILVFSQFIKIEYLKLENIHTKIRLQDLENTTMLFIAVDQSHKKAIMLNAVTLEKMYTRMDDLAYISVAALLKSNLAVDQTTILRDSIFRLIEINKEVIHINNEFNKHIK